MTGVVGLFVPLVALVGAAAPGQARLALGAGGARRPPRARARPAACSRAAPRRSRAPSRARTRWRWRAPAARPSPGGRPSQRAASTRSTWPWANSATSPGDRRQLGEHAVRPLPHLVRGLPAGTAVAPQRPSPGRSLADLRRGEPLVLAVVPLDQLVAGLGHVARSPARRQVSSGPAQRAREHALEAPARERHREQLGLPAALLGQRHVGAAGVPAGPAPLGLPVAHRAPVRPGASRPELNSAPIGEPEKKKNQISNARERDDHAATRIRSALESSGLHPVVLGPLAAHASQPGRVLAHGRRGPGERRHRPGSWPEAPGRARR